jgi:hypothetical protein
MPSNQEDWERYGRALHRAMAEVLQEFPEEARPNALETADYWISVGLTIGQWCRSRSTHPNRVVIHSVLFDVARRMSTGSSATSRARPRVGRLAGWPP